MDEPIETATPNPAAGDVPPADGAQPGRSDATNWARPVERLRVSELAAGASHLNVEGRSVVGPLQGYGQLWQKTYRVRLAGAAVTPGEVIATWKVNFSEYWPSGSRFYAPLTGINPGEVAALNVRVGGMPVSTGMLVMYSDDESFALMTPQGHMESGWITFSAYADEDGATVAQVQSIARANDPMYEVGLLLRFAHRAQEKFWDDTLRALAAYHGVRGASVSLQRECLDPRLQWRQAHNILYNAGIRTMAHTATAPVRIVRLRLRRRSRHTPRKGPGGGA